MTTKQPPKSQLTKEFPNSEKPTKKSILGLRHPEDIRTLVFMVGYWLLVAFQWNYHPFYYDHLFGITNVYLNWTLKLTSALVLLLTQCWWSFMISVIVHNTVHTPLFYSKLANSIFHAVLSCTYGQPVSSFVSSHNLSHHKHTQTRRDVFRSTKLQYKWHFLNLIMYYPLVAKDVIKSDFAYMAIQKRLKRPIFKQALFEVITLQFFQLLMLLWNWKLFILIVASSQWFGKWFIFTMNLIQHDGCETGSKWNHSRNFVDPILNYLILNNGYHTMHHMYPGKHWTELKELHEKMVKPHIDPRLDCPSLFGYLFKTFIYPGKRTMYDGRPIELGEYGLPDLPWMFHQKETFSKKDVKYM